MAAREAPGTRVGTAPVRRRRRPSRRDEILRTAAHVILERGFELISLVDVARASKVSKAGLYYHFRSKQELLAAIISYAQDLHEEEVGKVLADCTEGDEEELRRLIHSHAMMMTQEDDAAFAILAVDEMRSLLRADRTRVARRKRAYLDVLRERLERLAAAGKLREVDITTATHTLAGMVLWLPKWYRQPGRLSAEEMADEITELAMHAVLQDSSCRPRGRAHAGSQRRAPSPRRR
jgi:AcrR family transcriptional regulator